MKNPISPLSMQADFFSHQTEDFTVFQLGISKQIYFSPREIFFFFILLCVSGTVVCIQNLEFPLGKIHFALYLKCICQQEIQFWKSCSMSLANFLHMNVFPERSNQKGHHESELVSLLHQKVH